MDNKDKVDKQFKEMIGYVYSGEFTPVQSAKLSEMILQYGTLSRQYIIEELRRQHHEN